MTEIKMQSEPPVINRLPKIVHLPTAERYDLGRTRRQQTPRSAHAEWQPARGA